MRNANSVFTARYTTQNDCCRCHNAKGIWLNPKFQTHWLCDNCFAEYLEDKKEPAEVK